MKKIKITSDAKQKSTVLAAVQSSENSNVELYQSILGGSRFENVQLGQSYERFYQ